MKPGEIAEKLGASVEDITSVLEYLEERNLVMSGSKGYAWTFGKGDWEEVAKGVKAEDVLVGI